MSRLQAKNQGLDPTHCQSTKEGFQVHFNPFRVLTHQQWTSTQYSWFLLQRNKNFSRHLKVSVLSNICRSTQIWISNQTHHNFQSRWHISQPKEFGKVLLDSWDHFSAVVGFSPLLTYILQLDSWFKQRQNFSIYRINKLKSLVTWGSMCKTNKIVTFNTVQMVNRGP